VANCPRILGTFSDCTGPEKAEERASSSDSAILSLARILTVPLRLSSGKRDKSRPPGLNACSPTLVFNLLEENEARPPAVHDQAFLVSPRSTGWPVDATRSMISAARARPLTSSMVR
jgi:hypothetical protein